MNSMINLVSWNIENQSNMVIFNGCLSALKIITKPNNSVKMDAPPCGGFEVLFLSRFGCFVSLSLAARPLP